MVMVIVGIRTTVGIELGGDGRWGEGGDLMVFMVFVM